uniref:Uncharacterized protein n=1 Tax=Paramoeba aestuarina TaxID=180227 RepID=A0A7S4PFK6_9EUKA|mmetsp:Transcript_5510/g.8330  ORF Transcript_5510/g.8330 Transcript_5510/m.8330 type:complete len:107 (+) Transcript_5510:83-403(+)
MDDQKERELIPGQIVEIGEAGEEKQEEEEDSLLSDQLKMQEIMAQIEGRYEEARKERIIANLQANLSGEKPEPEEAGEDEITIFVHPGGGRRLVVNEETMENEEEL